MDRNNVCLSALTFMWWNQVHRWCCGRSKPNPITRFKSAFWIAIL